MKKVAVNVVSALTAHGKGGNLAGVVVDADALSTQEMQFIAANVGYSETAFVMADPKADFRLRFFDTEIEVDLCGHATIAAWSFLKTDRSLAPGRYSQNTDAGELGIELDKSDMVFMEQATPDFQNLVPPEEIAQALGVKVNDLMTELQPQIVSTGLSTLLVGLTTKESLANLQPDRATMVELGRKYDCMLVHPFALLPAGESLAIVRNFGPSFGVFEDAATGTSNGALLCYLKQKNLLPGKGIYQIEQGQYMGQPSYLYGKFEDDTVWIGGETTLVKQVEVRLD